MMNGKHKKTQKNQRATHMRQAATAGATRPNVSSLVVSSFSNKKAVLPQGNRAMPQVFFSVEVRQQHSLQV